MSFSHTESVYPSTINHSITNAKVDVVTPSEFKSTISTGSGSIDVVQARAICKYHLHGKCTRGDDCSYMHSSPTPQSSLPSSAVEPDKQTPTSTNAIDPPKRKGRDILDKYSFRKTLKVDPIESNNKRPVTVSVESQVTVTSTSSEGEAADNL